MPCRPADLAAPAYPGSPRTADQRRQSNMRPCRNTHTNWLMQQVAPGNQQHCAIPLLPQRYRVSGAIRSLRLVMIIRRSLGSSAGPVGQSGDHHHG